MGAALIGSVLLQMYWVRDAISINEEQFEKSTFEALNRVVKKMSIAETYKENLEVYNHVHAYPNLSISMNTRPQNATTENIPQSYDEVGAGFSVDSIMSMAQKISVNGLDDETCTCSRCVQDRAERFKKEEEYREKLMFERQFNPSPITQRIDLNYLDEMIEQELKNHAIDIAYDYGVYSEAEHAFVISNGRYLVSDQNEQAGMVGWDLLYNSEYRVALFPDDIKSPGMLMIHFPAKASLVWESVWKTLLASILFTAIILFCFAYTIQVIYRQKKLSSMKTDFINNMTHEFKTPIATISLAADSITSPRILGNEDKVSRFANIIKQENKRMNSQVEKVLQMALIDNQEFKLNITEIDVHEVIQQAVIHTGLQVEKRGGKVTSELNATNHVIEGDLTHIGNIISNLMENANKYSPDAPQISVHTRNVPTGVEVIVKDKGIGMTKEARKNIFDKFYRVHTGDVHDVKGFGLGLSYVKAIITAHKGQIDVKSELGKGSSFILVLPHKQISAE